ncbi:T9SS type A sorting domain-containing protein [Hymenobacter rubidus]|uniref:T9SS type A sorting domain-containing protein n=1 Tax=Hymenobacter rubidus TaxID=1441626 RepID=UPI00191D594A|nr:T9SS type A sorting domain-containing protein [Hymenobacter rubidus]
MLTKLTPTGDTLWHTLVPRRLGRDWDAASLCEDAQGNYIVAGNSRFTIVSGFYADNIHLTRFRPRTGQVVNDTMLYRAGQTYASSVLRTSTGSLLIGGWYTNGVYGGSDAFLAEWSAFTPLAVQPAVPTAKANLMVFPNPANAAGATVQLPAASRAGGVLTAYDELGRACARQAVAVGSAAVVLPPGGLLPGVYLLRYEGQDGTRATTRLVYQ